jgi:hypothetical protein
MLCYTHELGVSVSLTMKGYIAVEGGGEIKSGRQEEDYTYASASVTGGFTPRRT